MEYQISHEVLFSKVDEEVIIMSIEADSYFGLDPVGSRIWELLEKPATFEDLVHTLMEEFEVEEAQCRRDAETFIADMIARNLVVKLEPQG